LQEKFIVHVYYRMYLYRNGEQKNQKIKKTGKKITEKTEPWKNPIKIFFKIFNSVQFRFNKLETEKIETGSVKKKDTIKALSNF
jgi:hypothetical protein